MHSLILAFHQSFKALAAAVQQASGKSIEITHIPIDVLKENLKKGDLIAFLSLMIDSGKAVHPNPLSNHLYPDWNPKSAVEVIVQQEL
jgi:hypothetical protein